MTTICGRSSDFSGLCARREVEIHHAFRDVDSQQAAKCPNSQYEENRIQKHRRMLKERQNLIPKKRDVKVITESEHIQAIRQQSENEAIAQENKQKKVLNNV